MKIDPDITITIPRTLHTRIKVAATIQRKSIKEYLDDLVPEFDIAAVGCS